MRNPFYCDLSTWIYIIEFSILLSGKWFSWTEVCRWVDSRSDRRSESLKKMLLDIHLRQFCVISATSPGKDYLKWHLSDELDAMFNVTISLDFRLFGNRPLIATMLGWDFTSLSLFGFLLLSKTLFHFQNWNTPNEFSDTLPDCLLVRVRIEQCN